MPLAAVAQPLTAQDPDHTWTLGLLSRLLRPRQRLTVSEWADAYRVLSPKASSEPGPWRTARMPHLREIMDALSVEHPAQRVVYKKPAQHGGTETAVNWIGYVMDHVRTAKPMQIVVPTDKLLVRWRHQRLTPMIESAQCLREKIDVSKSREGTNRLDLLDYPGGLLYLTTAGSASNLKSDSICYAVCDEADEYEWDVGGRGDPMGLIESRQANFPRRKLFIFSTPTVKGASRIDGEYEASDQRRLHVPCPHCGEAQTLEWEHVHWTADLSRVWYTCAHNGCVIEEQDKPAMLAAGRWIAKYPERAVVGFHDNALYSPLGLGYSWRELAQQWLRADTDELKQQFTNERLALAWTDKRTDVRQDDLEGRAEHYPLRQVQPGGGLVTAGVDTQDNRLAVQIIAWGQGGCWWVLDYVELPGDPSRPEVWVALTDLLSRPLETTAGQRAIIEATAIDMQGHRTEAVKGYVRACKLPRVIAIAGSRYRLAQPLGRPRKTDYSISGRIMRHGMQYHEVGTEICKDALFADLRADAELPEMDRHAHFSQDLPPEYFAGLLAEVWDAKKNRYVKKRGATERNEALDTWCYAFAAAHHPGLRLDRMRKVDWERRAGRLFGAGADDAPVDAGPAAAPATHKLPPAASERRRDAPGGSTSFGKDGWGL